MFNIKVGDIVELKDGTIGKCADVYDGRIKIGGFVDKIKIEYVKRIVTSVTLTYKYLYEIKDVNSCDNCVHLDYNSVKNKCTLNSAYLNKLPSMTTCEGWEKE